MVVQYSRGDYFTLDDSYVLYNVMEIDNTEGQRVYICLCLREELLNLFYTSERAKHNSSNPMYMKIRQKYYWKRLENASKIHTPLHIRSGTLEDMCMNTNNHKQPSNLQKHHRYLVHTTRGRMGAYKREPNK